MSLIRRISKGSHFLKPLNTPSKNLQSSSSSLAAQHSLREFYTNSLRYKFPSDLFLERNIKIQRDSSNYQGRGASSNEVYRSSSLARWGAGASRQKTPLSGRRTYFHTFKTTIREPWSRKQRDGWPWSEPARNNEPKRGIVTQALWAAAFTTYPIATMIHFPPENFVTLTIHLKQCSLILGTHCLPTRRPLRLTPNIYCFWLVEAWMHDLTTLERWESEERREGVQQQAAAGCEKTGMRYKCLVKEERAGGQGCKEEKGMSEYIKEKKKELTTTKHAKGMSIFAGTSISICFFIVVLEHFHLL